MRILTGAYNHSVDAKNRIRIPSKLRAGLFNEGEEDVERDEREQKKFSLIFHLGTDGCIEVYTQEVIDKMFAKFASIDQTDLVNFRKIRTYLSTFETVDSDPQGRMVIPNAFRKHAKINKDIVICGVMDHIEIWSKEYYSTHMNVEEMSVEDINQLVQSLGKL